MNIAELARQAQVTPRTIRYYVEQGLLPPPGRGRIAIYGEEHLKAIRLIQRLKRHYLPLDEIRDTLQRLTPAEVEELIKDGGPQVSKEASSAADYIAGVLEYGERRQMLKEQTPPLYTLPTQGPNIYNSPPPPPVGMAPLYVAPPPPAAASRVMSQAADYPEAYPPAPVPSQQANATPYTEHETGVKVASTWQRVPLSPDIELHYRVPTHTHTETLVARLVAAFGQMLKDIIERNGGK